MANLSIKGPALATKVLCGKDVVAEDVKFSLPEVTFQTVEVQALGKMDLPLPLTDAMEATITSIGFDKGFYKMLGLESRTFEFRFVQNETQKDGTQKRKACKAFIKGVAKVIPGGDIEICSSFEGSIPIAVTRYQLYVDGKEVHKIDKLKGDLVINGKNYAKELKSLI